MCLNNMMKINNILLVNNTIFYEEGEKLFINKETGHFFVNVAKLGYRVSAFQISQLKTDRDSFANFDLCNKGLKIIEIKRRGNRVIPFIRAFFTILKLIRLNDFIYVFYPGPICQVIALLCFIFNKPYGIYLRGEQGIYSSFSKMLLKKAQFVLTISPEFTNKVNVINSNSFTIRPMIGFNEQDIIQHKQIKYKEVISLLYVGRIVFDKGLFELVDATKKLIENGFSVHLNLIGGGTDLEKLQAYVRSNSLEDKVSFHGMISDLNELKMVYLENDIFVLPSYHEGFPRVLYEAMMMHMPIVTTFVGSICHLMKDKENCLEIKVQNTESIVEKITLLIKNRFLAQSISDSAVKTINNYLIDKKQDHAKQLNSLLKKIK